MWRRILAAALDALYPPRCVARQCGVRGAWLCATCLAAVCPVPHPQCPRCSVPLPGGGACPGCLAQPPQFQQATAAGLYEGALRDAIRALKYRRLRIVAPTLGALAADAFGDAPPDALVVPVPAHGSRTAERRIDQGRLLATAVAGELRRPLDASVLARIRPTAPQVGLSLSERRTNVAGAFATTRRLEGRAVILVDDVLTTGATANACARALLDAGGRSVLLCAVARAVPSAGTALARRL